MPKGQYFRVPSAELARRAPEMRRLWEMGWTEAEIGERYGVSQVRVSQIIRSRESGRRDQLVMGARAAHFGRHPGTFLACTESECWAIHLELYPEDGD